MGNHFGTDVLIQAEDPASAARFYVEGLGFQITDAGADLISLEGQSINLYIERGPPLGPVLEVFVESVAETRRRLVEQGWVLAASPPRLAVEAKVKQI